MTLHLFCILRRPSHAAWHWAGIVRIFHGDAITDAGPPRYPGC